MKIEMKKLALAFSFFSVATFVACSSENPIEIANGRVIDDISLESNVSEAELVKADSIYKEENPESSSSVEESSSSQRTPYLPENMKLKITLKSYKQVVASMSESNPKGNPEVRFAVKFFSEGIQVRMAVTEEYTVSPVLLSGKDITEWTGENSVSVDITRGVDEVELCPMVTNLDENEDAENPNDVDISSRECFVATSIGYLTGPVAQNDYNDIYQLDWTIELY